MLIRDKARRRKIVADCLEAARTGAGLTRQQIAERMSTDELHVREWESGKRQMDLVELNVFCRAIGLPMSRFIDELEAKLEHDE
jgi:transcriptional regulator with XRE-family HTH domain